MLHFLSWFSIFYRDKMIPYFHYEIFNLDKALRYLNKALLYPDNIFCLDVAFFFLDTAFSTLMTFSTFKV